MRSFHFPAGHGLAGIAAVFALILIAPQTSLAQAANTAYGLNALTPNSGSYNSAFGYYSLYYNAGGVDNTAIGAQALFSNGTGHDNAAVGVNALYANNTGYNNSALGVNALYSNTTGSYNTAVGVTALYANSTGILNTALGHGALYSNTTGQDNTAIGTSALIHNTLGNGNVANGLLALAGNTTGAYNVAVGYSAGAYITTGNHNIMAGDYSGYNLVAGSYNIDIGNRGASGDSGVIRIGTSSDQTKTFIAGISGVTSSRGVQVYINSAGQLGTLTSSERFKKDIKSIESISEKLLQLRPVSFIYKEDDKNELQYGLIAEEVAKVYPELVQYDQEGKPFTVYYHLLTPLLLSEMQKEHAVSKTQQGKIDAQQADLANLNQQLITQRAEMLAMLQQQKRQLNEMAAMQQKMDQLDNLLQANGSKGTVSEKVAMVAAH